MKLHRDLDEIPRVPVNNRIYKDTCQQLKRQEIYGFKAYGEDPFGIKAHNEVTVRAKYKIRHNKALAGPRQRLGETFVITRRGRKVVRTRISQLEAIDQLNELIKSLPCLTYSFAKQYIHPNTLRSLTKQGILEHYVHELLPEHCIRFASAEVCPQCSSPSRTYAYDQKAHPGLVMCNNCYNTYFEKD